MHRIDINEADWKLYRSRITNWQESYMERLCQEYAAVLTSDKNASDRFWEIFDRIKVDSIKTGVIARNARSSMISIAPPTKPCRQIFSIKKISLRQKNLKCDSIPAFFFLDKFPFCFHLFGKV